MNKKIFFNLFACAAAVFFFSCASVPKAPFPSDGIYSYDFERYVDSVELALSCKAYGVDAWQNIKKKSWGNAVFMQAGTFVEPETGLVIFISPDGEVSSPQNPSISGKYKKNGSLFFQGYYEENSQINKIVINASLLPCEPADRASKAFDGNFTLIDNGTERKQKVKIEDGLYLWDYEDKNEDDFETWPVIVAPDGSISCGFELTVNSGFKGISETMSSTTNESLGKVTPSGSINIQTITKTAGTGYSGDSNTITYSGIRGSENLAATAKDEITESPVIQKLTKSKKPCQNVKKENPPEWYSDFIPNDSDYLYGTARKTHEDKDTALAVADITAQSYIKSSLIQTISNRSESKVSMEKGEKTKNESSFFRAIDSFSTLELPCERVESFYDTKTKTAYVVLRLSRSEAGKIIEKTNK